MAAGPFVIQTVARAGERPRFRMPDFFYGGQALIEGVMMRGRTTVAMSVRPPSGEIVTLSEPLPEALVHGRWIKVPFVRGMFVLYETLVLGTRMLMRSAAIAAEGDDIEMRLGHEGESYAGIRKEDVHVGGRICLADACGPFGNPTSDSARTMVTTATTRALVVVFAPQSVGTRRLGDVLDATARRMKEFTGARETARLIAWDSPDST